MPARSAAEVKFNLDDSSPEPVRKRRALQRWNSTVRPALIRPGTPSALAVEFHRNCTATRSARDAYRSRGEIQPRAFVLVRPQARRLRLNFTATFGCPHGSRCSSGSG
jgi:hypothetical protein